MPKGLASIWRRIQPVYVGSMASAAFTGLHVRPRTFPDARFNAIIGVLIGVVLVLGLTLRVFARHFSRHRAAHMPGPRIEPEFAPTSSGDTPSDKGCGTTSPGPDIATWSIELLNALEWRRFEAVCTACFRSMGLEVSGAQPADVGQFDLVLSGNGAPQTTILLRCLPSRSIPVGEEEVRGLLADLRREGPAHGILVTSGTFTRAALELADGATLRLLNGRDLLGRLTQLSAAQCSALLEHATEGDFVTPSCTNCGEKLLPGKDATAWRCPHCNANTQPTGRAAPLPADYWGRLLP